MNDYMALCRYQLSAGMILMVVFAVAGNYLAGFSCLFGSMLMASGSWELARRLASSAASVSADDLQGSLYRGAVVRFVLILVGLAVGFLLGLDLPAVAGGMFAAQVLFYFASLKMYRDDARD
ncbi:hypothetical protein FEF65_04230 [Mariprofundus erugo]|uniref:ATP synthase subunit I n=1 Tax=Mariprofundus erugo TaxID=2528639 RepID=A0A5R9GTH7_9PROT|nr:ATP synthase subunit I [Mariprofundus erugo]TLS68209.1 hypothetical protein FEF65_04230 [Mariprofundus erugo]